MNTIKRCTSLLVIAVLCTACSESEDGATIPTLADTHDGTVYMTQTGMNIGQDIWTQVKLNVTNYTDHDVDHMHCNVFGYYNDTEVASEFNQRVWRERDDMPDLMSGESRSGTLGFVNSPNNTRMNRFEWACHYESNGDVVFFEGES